MIAFIPWCDSGLDTSSIPNVYKQVCNIYPYVYLLFLFTWEVEKEWESGWTVLSTINLPNARNGHGLSGGGDKKQDPGIQLRSSTRAPGICSLESSPPAFRVYTSQSRELNPNTLKPDVGSLTRKQNMCSLYILLKYLLGTKGIYIYSFCYIFLGSPLKRPYIKLLTYLQSVVTSDAFVQQGELSLGAPNSGCLTNSYALKDLIPVPCPLQGLSNLLCFPDVCITPLCSPNIIFVLHLSNHSFTFCLFNQSAVPQSQHQPQIVIS